jgi:ribosomal protein RSM22 (predicted rRNA methylase)
LVDLKNQALRSTPHTQLCTPVFAAGLTSDMLVLIEPGTPAGFANIIEARSSILDYEGRRAAKLHKRIDTASHPAPSADDQPVSSSSSSSSSRDDAMALKANSKWFGAHVVAPCPHDAPCPLAQPGSKAWCHFGTRFQRPGFMQQAKALPGARMNPADHQDERYSYVVLR